MKVTLTDEILQDAERVEQEIMQQSFMVEGGNYTGLESERRFYFGRLAEWGLFLMLFGLTTDFSWDRRLDYLLPDDGFDLIVKGKRVDVKMIPYYGKYLLVSTVELERHERQGKKVDIFVGIKVNDVRKEAEFCCWFPAEMVKTFEKKTIIIPSYTKEIKDVEAPYNDIGGLIG